MYRVLTELYDLWICNKFVPFLLFFIKVYFKLILYMQCGFLKRYTLSFLVVWTWIGWKLSTWFSSNSDTSMTSFNSKIGVSVSLLLQWISIAGRPFLCTKIGFRSRRRSSWSCGIKIQSPSSSKILLLICLNLTRFLRVRPDIFLEWIAFLKLPERLF